MKFSLFLFLVFITACANAQDSMKAWDSSDLLTWSDFKGPADGSSKLAAFSVLGAQMRYSQKQVSGVYSFTFEVVCVMSKNQSWSKKERQTPQLLKHEQTHFDIAEFFARKLIITLNEHKFTNNFKNEITEIQKQEYKDRMAMQVVYDNQTNHSINKEMQQKWEAYVADLLNANYTLEEALQKMPVI